MVEQVRSTVSTIRLFPDTTGEGGLVELRVGGRVDRVDEPRELTYLLQLASEKTISLDGLCSVEEREKEVLVRLVGLGIDEADVELVVFKPQDVVRAKTTLGGSFVRADYSEGVIACLGFGLQLRDCKGAKVEASVIVGRELEGVDDFLGVAELKSLEGESRGPIFLWMNRQAEVIWIKVSDQIVGVERTFCLRVPVRVEVDRQMVFGQHPVECLGQLRESANRARAWMNREVVM